MREDVLTALRHTGMQIDNLNAIQRILLITDGTVTDILEAYFREPIEIVPLQQDITNSLEPVPELDLEAGSRIMQREILLRGKLSRRNMLHADSLIVPGRLSETLLEGLLLKKQTIGHLLLMHKLETHREIIQFRRQQAGRLAAYFAVHEEALLLARTYIVLLGGLAIMRITERFPEYGLDNNTKQQTERGFSC